MSPVTVVGNEPCSQLVLPEDPGAATPRHALGLKILTSIVDGGPSVGTFGDLLNLKRKLPFTLRGGTQVPRESHWGHGCLRLHLACKSTAFLGSNAAF